MGLTEDVKVVFGHIAEHPEEIARAVSAPGFAQRRAALDEAHALWAQRVVTLLFNEEAFPEGEVREAWRPVQRALIAVLAEEAHAATIRTAAIMGAQIIRSGIER